VTRDHSQYPDFSVPNLELPRMRVRAGKAMKVRELIEFIGRGYLQTLKIATLM
jgi:hypothetical protein